MESFSPHDLHCTCVTHLEAMLVPGHVIARLLNHKQKDITIAICNKYQYLNEKREALDSWGAKVARIAAPWRRLPRRLIRLNDEPA